MVTSAFEKFESQAWPNQYKGRLAFTNSVMGGTPSDPRVVEGWLRTKFKDNDDTIRAMVAETMLERGCSSEEALKSVADTKSLKGFKRDERGLYLEGRHLKACLKESAGVALTVGKIEAGKAFGITGGNLKKGIKSFLPEHIFVAETKLHLLVDGQPIQEPTGVDQKFVHVFSGSGIQYSEYVDNAELEFTVETDWEFEDEFFAMLFLTAQKQGLGASRSMGFGTFVVTDWAKVS